MKKKELFAALMAALAVTPVSADDLYQEVNLDREGRVTKPHTVSSQSDDGAKTPTFSYGWRPNHSMKTVGTHSFNVDLLIREIPIISLVSMLRVLGSMRCH